MARILGSCNIMIIIIWIFYLICILMKRWCSPCDINTSMCNVYMRGIITEMRYVRVFVMFDQVACIYTLVFAHLNNNGIVARLLSHKIWTTNCGQLGEMSSVAGVDWTLAQREKKWLYFCCAKASIGVVRTWVSKCVKEGRTTRIMHLWHKSRKMLEFKRNRGHKTFV